MNEEVRPRIEKIPEIDDSLQGGCRNIFQKSSGHPKNLLQRNLLERGSAAKEKLEDPKLHVRIILKNPPSSSTRLKWQR